MLHPTGMEWTWLVTWGGLAGLMAAAVAAWDWYEARVEARRRVQRLLQRARRS